MQHARGGYTIIEVLIVLAIALVTFFVAVTVFSGRQGRTEFSQAMRDVESRIKTAVNDVGVSQFPDASNYSCEIDNSSRRPKLTSVPEGTGQNEDCIFLGKAVQLIADNNPGTVDSLNVYTVLGRRTTNGTASVTSFSDANPSPIVESTPGGGDPDLTEEYTMLFGAAVASASATKVDGSSGNTDLVGFYNSLQPTEPTAQGSQSLLTKGYMGFDTNPSNPKSQIKQAIEGAPLYPSSDIKAWTVCFQSGSSNEFAQLIVNVSLAGVTTQIKYVVSC